MESKIHSIIIISILAFALITGILATFVPVFAQGEGEDTGGMTNGEDGMTGEWSNITDGGMTNGGTGITDGLTNNGP